MRIHVATDHAGLEFSQRLQERLRSLGHSVIDHGPRAYDPGDDYPSFCVNAAQAVANDWADGVEALGVVFGGSGNGEQIAANKVRGVRAALVWNLSTARLARQHNNANVIAIGARQHDVDDALALIEAFVAEPFSSEPRHLRRIEQVAEYESTGAIVSKEILHPNDSAVEFGVPVVLGESASPVAADAASETAEPDDAGEARA